MSWACEGVLAEAAGMIERRELLLALGGLGAVDDPRVASAARGRGDRMTT